MRLRAGLIVLGALSCSTLKLPLDLQARVDAAPIGTEVLVPAGIWQGELTIRKPVTIRGAGKDTTTFSGIAPIVVLSPGVTIEGLAIRGIDSAARIGPHGDAVFRDVRLAGAGLVLAINEGGALRTDDVTIECAQGALAGLIAKGGRWTGHDITVNGPCRRGVELDAANADVSGLTVQGAQESGLHALESTLIVDGLTIGGLDLAAPGFFEARSTSTLSHVHIVGGEEGMLLRGGRTQATAVTLEKSTSAGVAAVGGEQTLEQVEATGPFAQAAISSLGGGQLTGRNVNIMVAGSVGVLAVKSRVDVDGMKVDGARTDADGDFGHGVMVDRSIARLRHLGVTHADGAAVYASGADSSVAIEGVTADKVSSGVMTALGAHAVVSGLRLSNAPVGVVTTGSSTISIKDSSLESLLGSLVCRGSTVAEQGGVVYKSDVRSRGCDDDNLGEAWNQILSAP